MIVWFAPCKPDSHPHIVTNTKCRIYTILSPDDVRIVARKMYWKEINMLRKVVQQAGFIYKIKHILFAEMLHYNNNFECNCFFKYNQKTNSRGKIKSFQRAESIIKFRSLNCVILYRNIIWHTLE